MSYWTTTWDDVANARPEPLSPLQPEHQAQGLEAHPYYGFAVLSQRKEKETKVSLKINQELIEHLTALRGDGVKDEFTKVMALGNSELSAALKRVVEDRRGKALEAVAVQIAELLELAERRKKEAIQRIRDARRELAAAQSHLQFILAAEGEALNNNFIPLLKVVDPSLESVGMLAGIPDAVKNPVRARKVAAKKTAKKAEA